MSNISGRKKIYKGDKVITIRHLRKFVGENLNLFPEKIVPISGQTIEAVLKQAESTARNNPQKILTAENVTNLFGQEISQKLFKLMESDPGYLRISDLYNQKYHTQEPD